MTDRIGLRARAAAAAALAALVVLAVYSNHFGNDFHFDDAHTVQSNPYIRDLHNLGRFFTDARTFSTLPDHQEYRPVVSASLALDYHLAGGLRPFWFHASTFAWYLAQLGCMYLLFRRLLGLTGAGSAGSSALFATMLYAVHPVSAETVNYIVQRADLYSTLGVVAGLWVWVRWPRARRLGLYLLPVAAGALAKPEAIMFAAVLAVYVFLFEEGGRPGAWPRVLRKCAPAAAACAVLFGFTRVMTAPGAALGGGPLAAYLASQPAAILHYFTQFFAPLELCADTGGQPLAVSMDTGGFFGLCLLACLAMAAWRAARHPVTRPIAFGIAWFLLALAPTSLVPLAEARNDHRMFFPFVGLALAATWTAALLVGTLREAGLRRIAAVACTAALCVYAYGAHRRNEVWHSEESLWRDVVEKSPANGRGLMNYGLTQMAKGDLATAYAYFERARLFAPNYSLLEINLGVVCGALRRDAEAEEHFRRALALAPNDSQSYTFYGRWLETRGRGAEAVAVFDRAAALNPGDPVLAGYRPTPESLLRLSLSYYQAGRFEDCIHTAQRALQLRPAYAEAYNNIAAAYQALHQWRPAIVAAQEAVRLKPDFQLARNNLAWSESQLQRAAR